MTVSVAEKIEHDTIEYLGQKLRLARLGLVAVDADLKSLGWPKQAAAAKLTGALLDPVIHNLECGMSAADYERFALQVETAKFALFGMAGENGVDIEDCLGEVANELKRLALA